MTAPATKPISQNSPIFAEYRERTPGSLALYEQAQRVLPSGIAHDTRMMDPWPVYIDRAEASRKWDVDGNRYVDYMGGHGALLLGHNHPAVVEAVTAQLSLGTHYGSCHPLEVRWAGLICDMVPSAERVRFTNSGTEATLLAIRLARASTGKTKVLRFSTHFHGWHDHFAAGYMNHFDGSPPDGVLASVAGDVLHLRTDRPREIRELLGARDDIAAVILEPTGASWGRVPLAPELLREVRALAAEAGILVIFDEVITGFRVAPGGAQAHLGVTPDMTTLAKIAAGGLSGGILAGRADLIDLLDFEKTRAAGREKILHFGTFNANPLSAAAGIAALEQIRDGAACSAASDIAARLRDGITEILVEMGLAWAAYGEYSGFHLFTNPERRAVDPRAFDPLEADVYELKHNDDRVVNKLRVGMLNRGVDINGWPGGLTSAVHTDADLDQTLDAFRVTLRDLREERDLDDWL